MKVAIINTGLSFVVLGFLAFSANWGSSSSLFLSLTLCFLYSLGISRLVDDEESDSVSFVNFLGVIFALMIFLSAPLWDEEGYCSEQITTQLINESPTFEDVLKQRQRTDVAIYSDAENCTTQGGWNYMEGFEKFLLIVTSILQAGIFLMVILPILNLIGRDKVISPKQFDGNGHQRIIDEIIQNQKNLSDYEKLVLEADLLNRLLTFVRQGSEKNDTSHLYVNERGTISKGFDEPFKLLKILKELRPEDFKDLKGLAENLDWFSSTIMKTYTVKNIPGINNSAKNSEDVGKRKLEKLNTLREELNLI